MGAVQTQEAPAPAPVTGTGTERTCGKLCGARYKHVYIESKLVALPHDRAARNVTTPAGRAVKSEVATVSSHASRTLAGPVKEGRSPHVPRGDAAQEASL